MNLADQKHPQEANDRQIVNKLLQGKMNDENLADLARLRIRYRNFPGARELQRDLNLALQQWGLTEEELFEKTRKIYAQRKFNQHQDQDVEDWS